MFIKIHNSVIKGRSPTGERSCPKQKRLPQQSPYYKYYLLFFHLLCQKSGGHSHGFALSLVRAGGAVIGQQAHRAGHIAAYQHRGGAQQHPGRTLTGQHGFFRVAGTLVGFTGIHQLFQRLTDAAVGQLPPAAAADGQDAVPVGHKGRKRELAAEHLRILGGKGVYLPDGRILFKDHLPISGGKDLQWVSPPDALGAADLLGDHHPAKFIDAAHDTGCFHLYCPPYAVGFLQVGCVCSICQQRQIIPLGHFLRCTAALRSGQGSATINKKHRKAGVRMAHILILGGGAAGLAAALAAAQTAPTARVTVLERNPRVGKKLLATGNGRCNLDNTAAGAERYFTSTPAALQPLLAAVDAAAPLDWFRQLGLYTRTDEAGRVYPYSNQAADVLALLELHLQRLQVQLRTGCTVDTLRQSKGGYAVQFLNADGTPETLRADAVICAMGGAAGPQFGTDGFGPRFAAACGGRMKPLYPCLTALSCAKPDKSLAGIRAKATARLVNGGRVLAEETGEVQFTDYGLSGICIMQLSCLLRPGPHPGDPLVELDLFPAVPEAELAALFAARLPLLAGDTAAAFWLGLLHGKLGRAVWAAAGLPGTALHALPESSWQKLAHTAKHWQFRGLTPCDWRQAQTTGGGLTLTEVEPTFQFKGCPGLYFVGETLDCAGSCGGFNLRWAFGSGLAAGRDAARRTRSGKR